MDFFAKTELCGSLSASQYIDADRDLLRKVKPGSRLVNIVGDGNDVDKQLLWVLLDICSVDEINSARNAFKNITRDTVNVIAPATVNHKPVEKKNSKKKKNIPTSDGKTLKTNIFKRLRSYITTE
ncbi:MAG: hypothetical protein LBK94_04950 [Prevotellaceae bacterium]|jgi:hypothetical protein|nr:hypothetical protein [Prevotellaceae bacterium]